ncbi:MAG: ABC transporter permease [Chloroflexi bacterium]|nr:ABC transporter permease [Chloroflexota bacterium]
MIIKNLLRRKTRTALTLLGIAIGVAGVFALGAIAEGFINSSSVFITSSGADILLTQGDAPDVLLSAVDDSILPQVQSVAGVKSVAGTMWGIVNVGDVPYFIVVGLDPKEFSFKHYRVVEGNSIQGARQTIIGRTAAKTLKKNVGDNFKIQDVSYKIAGIYETGSGAEEMGAVIALKDAQEIFKKPRQVTYYQIKVTRPDLVDAVIKELEKRFPKLAASRSATYMDNQQTTQILRAMSWFIGILALLAGGLVMTNTMLMSVSERTREIGVLRAVGWKRARVLKMIFGEAMVLSILGGIVGIALGILFVEGLNQLPALAGLLENSITPGLFSQGMIIALILGCVGGLYPAWRASRLQPVEAMRYEGGGQIKTQKSKVKSDKLQSTRSAIYFSISNFFGLAIRNIFRQRTRTILTALAIGVGVGLVVALGGIGDGFVAQLSALGTSNGELTVSQAKASDISLAAVDDKVGRWIALLPEVENVSGMLFGVVSAPGTPYFILLGVDPATYAMRHFAPTEGARLRAPKEMMLGKVAAKNYKKKIGDTMQISGSAFRVVGIYETGTGYEDGAGLIALNEAQALTKKPNQVTFFFVKLLDPTQVELTRQRIEARWKDVSVSKSTEYAEKTNDVQAFRAEAAALSFLSVVIGGVGIMNAMLMSVSERTREIGTLRALGWRRRRVIGLIVRESLALSIVSGLAGIAVGVGLATLIGMEPTTGSFLKADFSISLFANAMLLALVLGGIGALYPAWRASNLSPVEALRYE